MKDFKKLQEIDRRARELAGLYAAEKGRADALEAELRALRGTCKESLQVGNAAKMCKALKRLREWVLMDLNENAFIADSSGNYLKLIEGTIEIANAALAAPARNCDIYDAKTAEKEFVRQTGSKSIRSKSVRWLYAAANGGDSDGK